MSNFSINDSINNVCSTPILRCYEIDIDNNNHDSKIDSNNQNTQYETASIHSCSISRVGMYKRMYGTNRTASCDFSYASLTPTKKYQSVNDSILSEAQLHYDKVHAQKNRPLTASSMLPNKTTTSEKLPEWHSFTEKNHSKISKTSKQNNIFNDASQNSYKRKYNMTKSNPVKINVISPFSFRGVEMRFIDDEFQTGDSNVLVDEKDYAKSQTNSTILQNASSNQHRTLDLPQINLNAKQTPQMISLSQKDYIQNNGIFENKNNSSSSSITESKPEITPRPIVRLCRNIAMSNDGSSIYSCSHNKLSECNNVLQECANSIDAKPINLNRIPDKSMGMAFCRTINNGNTNSSTSEVYIKQSPGKKQNIYSQCDPATSKILKNGREQQRTLTMNSLLYLPTTSDKTKKYIKTETETLDNNLPKVFEKNNLQADSSEINNITKQVVKNSINNDEIMNNRPTITESTKICTNDDINQDTGIDSSHSTTSSVDFKEITLERRKTNSLKLNSSPTPSSYFSSMDSLQIERSPTTSSQDSSNNWGFNADTNDDELNDKIMIKHATLEKSFSMSTNVIRRKFSAHSKMKAKRTSILMPKAEHLCDEEYENDQNYTINYSANFSDIILRNKKDTELKCIAEPYAKNKICDYGSDRLEDKVDPTELDFSRCSLVVRQQPELRVKSIIEKLTHMSGRDQRRALFSLKSIFQNDKDIVHEFVRNGGLECLIQIGRTCDQNHQNHILRAIGQLMLYVDGMNGIIANNETISWIYQLLDSNYRLVVKTALKLLLVFVEYTESNSLLLLAAISKIEKSRGRPEWSSIMRILNERQASDEETLIFAMTVINKTLNGVPDQDTFFDIVDVLESQGLEETIETMLKINNPQLSQQCVHYEQEVRKEDAALESDNGKSDTNDSVKIRSNINNYNSTNNFNQNNGLSSIERRNKRLRKQKEHLQMATTSNINELYKQDYEKQFQKQKQNGFQLNEPTLNTSTVTAKTQQKLPWRNFVEQQISSEYKVEQKAKDDNNNNEEFKNDYADNKDKILSSSPINSSSNFDKNSINTNNYIMDKMKSQSKVSLYDNDTNHNVEEKENIMDEEEQHTVKAPPPCIPTNIFSPTETKHMEFPESSKIISSNVPPAPSLPPPTNNTVFKPNVVDSDEETNNVGCAGGFAAMLQKRAKKMENSAFRRGIVDSINRQSESEIKWNEAAEKLKEKPMIINDLDFSSFTEFEQDPLVLVKSAQAAQDHNIMIGNKGTPPPAPPPAPGAKRMPPPPPLSFNMSGSRNIGINGKADANSGSTTASSNSTLKLHWKPAHADALPIPELKQKGTFWNNIDTVPQIDISKLSRLFEQKQKDTPIKKSGGETKLQVLQVLSVKRSQAINIGLTKLPPITVIPTAIRKFDASVLNKEGIEKILSTMMPSLEEVEHIREAQAENPSTPLGQAEQFLFNLSEIDCLLERLRLWLFMLDYHNLEKDVAESLMELNNAMKEIEESKTFKVAMGMLLTIGNALNGTDIKAFQLDYLSRASEVKDPVHKYPLTHHLAEYMLDHYPDGTDLYSEMGAVSRSSRLDFDAVLDNLKKMETECKACFDYVVKISHRDNNSSMKNKVNTFLIEVAERIHRLKHVHRTTMHRWNAFLLYFGYAPAEVKEQKPIAVFKMVIEFALEYRTNRDKILQMRKRMAEKRERNKTRGMMIGAAQASASNGNNKRQQTTIEASNVTEITDRERHQQMSFFLSNGDGTLTLGRRRGQPTAEQNASQIQAMRSSTTRSDNNANNSEYDELLDGVVRTVTAQADSRDHSRRRARLFNRKSLRRTRTIRQDHLSELNNLTTSYT